jgi:hypothetical protein
MMAVLFWILKVYSGAILSVVFRHPEDRVRARWLALVSVDSSGSKLLNQPHALIARQAEA